MFGDGFEQATILRTGPDGLDLVVTRTQRAIRYPGVCQRLKQDPLG